MNDDFLERTVDAIVATARTGSEGQIGDGKIFVLPALETIQLFGEVHGPGSGVNLLFLTTDLMFSSRVAGAAARLGLPVRTAETAAALLELTTAADQPPLVLLDLNTPGVDPVELVPALRAAANPPRAVVAYGPHVHEERLAAATAAGCDVVLSRGQFNAHMDDVIRKWISDV